MGVGPVAEDDNRLWLQAVKIFLVVALIRYVGYAASNVGYRDRVITPTEKDAYTYFIQHGQAPDYYPRFNAFVFTIEHSVPAINLGISNNWSADSFAQITEHPCYVSCIRNGLLAQRLLGWILSIFFIAGITGLVKSDK